MNLSTQAMVSQRDNLPVAVAAPTQIEGQNGGSSSGLYVKSELKDAVIIENVKISPTKRQSLTICNMPMLINNRTNVHLLLSLRSCPIWKSAVLPRPVASKQKLIVQTKTL